VIWVGAITTRFFKLNKRFPHGLKKHTDNTKNIRVILQSVWEAAMKNNPENFIAHSLKIITNL
jgi:hypothetical protein